MNRKIVSRVISLIAVATLSFAALPPAARAESTPAIGSGVSVGAGIGTGASVVDPPIGNGVSVGAGIGTGASVVDPPIGSGAYYDPYASGAAATIMYVYTGNTGRLHLRQGPGMGYASLGLYENGTQVSVFSMTGNWAYVQVYGVPGYMALNCLSYVPYTTPVNPNPSISENTTMYVQTGNSGRVHLRQGPGTSYRSLGLYENGSVITVLSRSGNWAYVRTAYDATGYMMLKFLSETPPYANPITPPYSAGSTTLYVQTGNSGRLHLRETPSASARSLGLYYNGTELTVLSSTSAWAYVSIQGQTGYMMRKFLTATPPSTGIVPPVSGLIGQYVVTHPKGSFVNFRSSPNLYANNVIARLPSGTPVTVTAWSGSWCTVYYNGQTGYMVSSFLK